MWHAGGDAKPMFSGRLLDNSVTKQGCQQPHLIGGGGVGELMILWFWMASNVVLRSKIGGLGLEIIKPQHSLKETRHGFSPWAVDSPFLNYSISIYPLLNLFIIIYLDL